MIKAKPEEEFGMKEYVTTENAGEGKQAVLTEEMENEWLNRLIKYQHYKQIYHM